MLLVLAAEQSDKVIGEHLTTSDWITAGAVIAGSLILAVFARRAVTSAIERGDADRPASRLAGRIVGYVIVAAGVLYAFAALNVKIGPLLAALGVGGVALAFALQDVLSNLLAGIILQTRRPFRRGDQVRLAEFEGVVRDIDLRTVLVETFDGLDVRLPNATVLQNPITNFTRTPTRRTTLVVRVPYDAELEHVQELLLDTVQGVDGVLDRPAPGVFIDAFGEAGVDFSALFWHDVAAGGPVRTEVAIAIKRALDREGIAMPFPNRTLRAGPGVRELIAADGR